MVIRIIVQSLSQEKDVILDIADVNRDSIDFVPNVGESVFVNELHYKVKRRIFRIAYEGNKDHKQKYRYLDIMVSPHE